jgi:NAD(P)-dependent dehydrogenase (short-subunit alcohol dehydrogenase family)
MLSCQGIKFLTITNKMEISMKIKDSIALVTGANRGLGAAFAHGLLAAGAAKVYAAARNPDTVTQAGVVPVRLNVTQPEQIAALAGDLTDITLLVNNVQTKINRWA